MKRTKTEQIVSTYLDYEEPELKGDIREIVEEKFLQKIQEEILASKWEEYEEHHKQLLAQKLKDMEIKARFDNWRNLLLEGFVTAFIVSLAAGQLTELIGYAKTESNKLIITLVCIVVFAVCAFAILQFKLFKYIPKAFYKNDGD